ncbi:hypothetical protein [Paraburkholderia aspalathi]|uniref:hypothetical protein n=1 Tax=Paraburkholderia aspalathi TaxID=1324617 RepID=UPI00190DE037|nr:hypothetical protein [Paraburkholderia aspalathi]
MSATLVDAQGRLKVEWSVEQREGSRYLREQLAITALLRDEDISVVSLLQTRVADAQASSELKGMPVVAGNFYLGFELPLAESHVDGDSVSFTLQHALPLEKNRTLVYSFEAMAGQRLVEAYANARDAGELKANVSRGLLVSPNLPLGAQIDKLWERTKSGGVFVQRRTASGDLKCGYRS